jgi:tRNA pseudouridine55 synthase
VLGLSTDSYDLLGIPTLGSAVVPAVERITATVRGMVGKIDLSVPVYSSHRLEGKPLFAWAREDDDGPPLVPVRRMTVGQIDITGITELPAQTLLETALERTGRVQGDFRQDSIQDAWRDRLADDRFYTAVGLTIQCASGTYIRSVVHEIGRRLGCGAVVADLRRVRVGPWRVSDPDVVTLSWPR